MNFQEFNSFFAPLGLLVAGIIMRLSNNQEMFGGVKKYWLLFIIGGILLLSIRLYEWFSK